MTNQRAHSFEFETGAHKASAHFHEVDGSVRITVELDSGTMDILALVNDNPHPVMIQQMVLTFKGEAEMHFAEDLFTWLGKSLAVK